MTSVRQQMRLNYGDSAEWERNSAKEGGTLVKLCELGHCHLYTRKEVDSIA